jgi:hypothetical protein
LFNLIAITSASASPDDSGLTDLPGELELKNRWFAQSRAQVSAGGSSRWYSALSPTVVVQPLPGAATVMLEPGGSHVLDAAGSWVLVPAGVRYQLMSSSSATLVVVEIR